MTWLKEYIGISFAQAFVASLVVWLWSMFMLNIDKFVAQGTEPTGTSFLLIPVMFMIVAVLAAGAVLGYPIYLAFNNQWPKAVGLVVLTLVWLGILAAILVLVF